MLIELTSRYLHTAPESPRLRFLTHQHCAGSMTVPEPQIAANGLEWSIHACPRQLRQEVHAVFPGLPHTDDLLIVPTRQQAQVDLVRTGETVEDEKDKLLEQFMDWARAVCDKLSADGHWCDYIDPCSGLPMLNQDGNTVYAEVEALSVLLGYKTANAGCCKIVLHPKWGSSVYPATMFARAPADRLMAAIREVDAELRSSTQ